MEGGYRGREGVEKFAADTRENWEELQSLPEEFRDLGDRVLVLGRMKGRGKGSGVPVDSPYVTILDFRGDRDLAFPGVSRSRRGVASCGAVRVEAVARGDGTATRKCSFPPHADSRAALSADVSQARACFSGQQGAGGRGRAPQAARWSCLR